MFIIGGTVNEKGYKELDPHIGAIYGEKYYLKDQCTVEDEALGKLELLAIDSKMEPVNRTLEEIRNILSNSI